MFLWFDLFHSVYCGYPSMSEHVSLPSSVGGLLSVRGKVYLPRSPLTDVGLFPVFC